MLTKEQLTKCVYAASMKFIDTSDELACDESDILSFEFKGIVSYKNGKKVEIVQIIISDSEVH